MGFVWRRPSLQTKRNIDVHPSSSGSSVPHVTNSLMAIIFTRCHAQRNLQNYRSSRNRYEKVNQSVAQTFQQSGSMELICLSVVMVGIITLNLFQTIRPPGLEQPTHLDAENRNCGSLDRSKKSF